MEEQLDSSCRIIVNDNYMQEFHLSDPHFKKVVGYICGESAPKSWKQPFLFKENTSYLYQLQSGPCGLFAVMQAYIVKISGKNPNFFPKACLWEAIIEIMQKIRGAYVFCTGIDFERKIITWKSTSDKYIAQTFLGNSGWTDDPNATLNFVASIVILLGPSFLKFYSIPDHFIAEDGYTNMTFVLLLITGEVVDSFIDGNQSIGGMTSKGLLNNPEFGLIATSDVQVYQKVGKLFAQPREKIFIAYYGSHFNTLVKGSNGFFELDSLSKRLWMPLSPKHAFYSQLQQICTQL